MRGCFALSAALLLAWPGPGRAHAPYEPEPVQLVLDALGVAYPPDEVRYRRHVPDDPDDLPSPHASTAVEAEAYAAWLDMLARRATQHAKDRGERNWAGHARDQLAQGRRWLERGKREEALRGNAPPRVSPISIARRIHPRRVDRTSRATSAYSEALRRFHRGARYAMAVLKARGIDPTREPDEGGRAGASSRERGCKAKPCSMPGSAASVEPVAQEQKTQPPR